MEQYLQEFLVIALVHFLAVASPGPDFAITLKQSIQYSLSHRQEGLEYAMVYARDMESDSTLADRFVGMYVNDYTLDYGQRGRAGVHELLSRGYQSGIIKSPVEIDFVEL